MYATNYLENAILNAMRGVTFGSPTNVYIGLFLSNPTENGTAGTEISYADYVRQKIVFSEPALNGNNMYIHNTEQIYFPKCTQNAGTVTYIGILDSVSGGNMLAYGKLTEDLIVKEGDAPVLLIGEVEFYLTGSMSNAFKTKVLNVFNGQTLKGFSSYLALFNGNPENGGAELAGDNYARAAVTFTAPAEAESGQNCVENSTTISFNRPSSDWGTLNYTAIYDSLSSGEPVWVQARSAAREIKKGYMPVVSIGGIRVAIN